MVSQRDKGRNDSEAIFSTWKISNSDHALQFKIVLIIQSLINLSERYSLRGIELLSIIHYNVSI